MGHGRGYDSESSGVGAWIAAFAGITEEESGGCVMGIWNLPLMSLNRLLFLQACYCVAGVGYNVVSYFIVANGGRQLSTSDPVTGAVFMGVYGLCLLTGRFGFTRAYRIIMGFFIVAGGYGGILVHLINYSGDPSRYASFAAWVGAVGINVYGLVLNVLAVMGRFEAASRR